MKRNLRVIDAPSNLGLSPPSPYSEPGCYKMPWVFHNLGILNSLDASYHGAVVPPRYSSQWKEGDGDRNAENIARYSLDLSLIVEKTIRNGEFPIVIGGDCSILIGNAVALRKTGEYGLLFVDAHSDYRHPGNCKDIRAAAGEDLAIVTGKGDSRLVDISGMRPYFKTENIICLGILSTDEDIQEMKNAGISVVTNIDLANGFALGNPLAKMANRTRGFWIHIDFDVIDKSEVNAVDCPEETGISLDLLLSKLRPAVLSPECVGIEFTIYDPDLDPNFLQGAKIVSFIRELLIER